MSDIETMLAAVERHFSEGGSDGDSKRPDLSAGRTGQIVRLTIELDDLIAAIVEYQQSVNEAEALRALPPDEDMSTVDQLVAQRLAELEVSLPPFAGHMRTMT